MSKKNAPTTNDENRCRIVLVTPPLSDAVKLTAQLEHALSGGDVASVILDTTNADETLFQAFAEKAVNIIQNAGAAALILNDTRIAGRVGADGLHIEGNLETVGEAIERYTPKLIVGTGNLRDRHSCLAVGELQPDFVFFGKIGADSKPEAHPRNLSLAEWWAQMVEIPAIIQAGSDIQSIIPAAETGAEFVALGHCVFESADPAEAVALANRLLDEHAPRFES
ncbi:thiamine phosphate synthase [Brucellaceae bacterium C25G]